MLKEFAWNTFENTGDIDAYMFFKEIQEKRSIVNETNSAGEEVASSSKLI